MLKRLATISLVVFVLSHSSALAGSKVPVTVINDDPGLDICGSAASVMGLDPNGDNFLALRQGPSSKFKMISKLPPETIVIICDSKGDWYGVVVSNGNDCQLDHSKYPEVGKKYKYKGSCLSGWVYGKYLGDFAG